MQRLLTGYGQYSKDMNNRRYDRRVSQYRKSDPDLPFSLQNRVFFGSDSISVFVPGSNTADPPPGMDDPDTSWGTRDQWERLYFRPGGIRERPQRKHGPTDGGEPLSTFTGPTCTLTLNLSKAGSVGAARTLLGGSSAGAQYGPYNHAYITLKNSENSYARGYRAGMLMMSIGYPKLGAGAFLGPILLAETGVYAKSMFSDWEPNPSGAVVETYDGSCDQFEKLFDEYVTKVNKSLIVYDPISNNSNAFAYSLLRYAGIDADTFRERVNTALGSWAAGLPGWGTLLNPR
jgi:hypothetical protein